MHSLHYIYLEEFIPFVQIYKRGTERYSDLSWEELKKEVTVTVENEVRWCCFPLCVHFFISVTTKCCFQLQGSVTEYEFCQEDYRLLQVEFWSKFYACCLQYQDVLSTPLALHISPATAMVCVLKKVPDPSLTAGRLHLAEVK